MTKIASSFQENEVIVDWVNSQELAPVVTCLGDGHDGVAIESRTNNLELVFGKHLNQGT